MKLAIFKIHIKKKLNFAMVSPGFWRHQHNVWIGLRLLSPLVVLKVLKAL